MLKRFILVTSKPKDYMVYHRRPAGETAAEHRATCIEKMEFDEQGLIKLVKITETGVKARIIK